MANIFTSEIDSPLGYITVFASDIGITKVQFGQHSQGQENNWSLKATNQLVEYFNGSRRDFELDYDFRGYTEFQKSVWQQLQAIPHGSTVSYMDIAKALNNTGAIRAVGAANGANPIGIIIPCHRVIGSDGSLTGYAHGIDMKKWLLEHEGAIEPEIQLSLF